MTGRFSKPLDALRGEPGPFRDRTKEPRHDHSRPASPAHRRGRHRRRSPRRRVRHINESVGGWIEATPTDGSITIWINEEGKLARLPFNPLGHALWAYVDSYWCIDAGDWMAGPCVVTGPNDVDGKTADVPEWVLPTLATLAATARFDRCGDEPTP